MMGRSDTSWEGMCMEPLRFSQVIRAWSLWLSHFHIHCLPQKFFGQRAVFSKAVQGLWVSLIQLVEGSRLLLNQLCIYVHIYLFLLVYFLNSAFKLSLE